MNKTVTLMSFNTQQGAHLKEGIQDIKSLLAKDLDFYHFQRFPLKWLSHLETHYHVYHTPSFLGANNGLVTFAKTRPSSHLNFYSSEKIFKDNNQSCGSVLLRFKKFSLLNTLPPYRSNEDSLTINDTLSHIEYSFKGLNDPAIVTGDFHELDKEILKAIPQSFKIQNSEKNFAEKNGNMLKLTKLMTNVDIKLRKEEVIRLGTRSVTHYPVIFHLEI